MRHKMNTHSFFVLLATTLLLLCYGMLTIHAQTVPYGTCFNETLDEMLLNSNDMFPQYGLKLVAIPFTTFWNFFVQAKYWTTWNPLFVQIQTTDFQLCGFLNATYSNKVTYNCTFPSSFVQPHYIVQMGMNDSAGAFAWQFTLSDAQGMFAYGRHTYSMKDMGNGTTLFASFEKAAGPFVVECGSGYGWTIGLQESFLDGITGATCLERVYALSQDLDPQTVADTCNPFVPRSKGLRV